MLDIHTVGAGGGSIARVDEGGLLRVGPESAGADPGPACYGKGEQATVTDAHVVLGRIVPRAVPGRRHAHRRGAAAARSVDRAGAPARARRAAAQGIIRVANANMERAIRHGFGGARATIPAISACSRLAGAAGCTPARSRTSWASETVMVPRSRERYPRWACCLPTVCATTRRGARARRTSSPSFDGWRNRREPTCAVQRYSRSADLRYAGQSYEITVPWSPPDTAAPFHAAHQRIYGYSRPDAPVEVVTIRVRAIKEVAKPELRSVRVPSKTPPSGRAALLHRR